MFTKILKSTNFAEKLTYQESLIMWLLIWLENKKNYSIVTDELARERKLLFLTFNLTLLFQKF